MELATIDEATANKWILSGKLDRNHKKYAIMSGMEPQFTTAQRRKFPLRKVLFVLVVLVVLVVLAGAGATAWYMLVYQKQATGETAKTTTQDEDLLTKSIAALGNEDYDALSPLVDNILQQPSYDTNPNYLYILTMFYLAIGDATSAKTYDSKLQALPNRLSIDQRFLSMRNYINPDSLSGRITQLEESLKNNKVMSTQ